MSKARKTTVSVKGTDVTVLVHREQDYISLTDIARHKNTGAYRRPDPQLAPQS